VAGQALNPQSSILRHDRKQNRYKIALQRALNDAVLSFPDMLAHDRNIAVPLRVGAPLGRLLLALRRSCRADLPGPAVNSQPVVPAGPRGRTPQPGRPRRGTAHPEKTRTATQRGG
jgi:hypothetical protein